jgi:hypothetical protein
MFWTWVIGLLEVHFLLSGSYLIIDLILLFHASSIIGASSIIIDH